jgi:hypothetical protein
MCHSGTCKTESACTGRCHLSIPTQSDDGIIMGRVVPISYQSFGALHNPRCKAANRIPIMIHRLLIRSAEPIGTMWKQSGRRRRRLAAYLRVSLILRPTCALASHMGHNSHEGPVAGLGPPAAAIAARRVISDVSSGVGPISHDSLAEYFIAPVEQFRRDTPATSFRSRYARPREQFGN